jgi:hypothetical protein
MKRDMGIGGVASRAVRGRPCIGAWNYRVDDLDALLEALSADGTRSSCGSRPKNSRALFGGSAVALRADENLAAIGERHVAGVHQMRAVLGQIAIHGDLLSRLHRVAPPT